VNKDKLVSIIEKYIHIDDNGGRLRVQGGRYSIRLQVNEKSVVLDNYPNKMEDAIAIKKLFAVVIAKLIDDNDFVCEVDEL
jgi:hypothetical protein